MTSDSGGNDNDPIPAVDRAQIDFIAACCDLSADEMIHRAAHGIPYTGVVATPTGILR
jgi:hypothetical protein